MRKLENVSRIRRIIESVIDDLSLDLTDISVLTEAASGPFVTTALIAAMAGADQVIALARNSRFGNAEEVEAYLKEWSELMGVGDRINISIEPAWKHASSCHIVTNLGFVRPINEKLINRLPKDAAISLMWETWEFRENEVDLNACKKRNIPVLGTLETHPRLNIFRYIGFIALKLLLMSDIEVFRSNICILGSGVFGEETQKVLSDNGARLLHIDPCSKWEPKSKIIQAFLKEADALVVVEHKAEFQLVGGGTGIPIDWLKKTGILLIHVCGQIDEKLLEINSIKKVPSHHVAEGFMAVTTDYVGPRPVIDLHAGGLKVGEALVKGMRKFGNADKAIEFALKQSPAIGWG
jgi:hypothetical protein